MVWVNGLPELSKSSVEALGCAYLFRAMLGNTFILRIMRENYMDDDFAYSGSPMELLGVWRN